MDIRIAEIFQSLSGEVGGFTQGSPCIFLRLAGCNLECPFCDTSWTNSLDSGESRSISSVVDEILSFPWNQLLITGGEPLIQKRVLIEFVRILRRFRPNMEIQIETNGTITTSDVLHLAHYWVVDYKHKDAMGGKPYLFNHGGILLSLTNNLWIKHIVGSREDLKRAIESARTTILPLKRFSISGIGPMEELVPDAILESGLPITLNIQLHKKIGVR